MSSLDSVVRLDSPQAAAVEGVGEEGPGGVVQVLRHRRHAVAVRHGRGVRAPTRRVARPAVQLRESRRRNAVS